MKRPTETLKMSIPEPLPQEQMDFITQQCEAAAARLPRNDAGDINYSRMSFCRVDVPYPMSWRQVKDVSRLFTAHYDMPVLVMPKGVPTSHKDIKPDFYSGEYTSFEAHIMLTRIEGDRQALFNIPLLFEKLRLLDPSDKTGPKVHDSYYWIFPGENPPTKGQVRPELTPKFSKYCYSVAHRNHNIVVYSDEKLELGQIYKVSGMSWDASDKKNTQAQPFLNAFMMVDNATPIRKLLKVDEDFFRKFKGLTHDDIRDAIAFPFEHSVRAYKNLLFSAIFYIQSTDVPLNILLMGAPNTTKSAFMSRMASISGDKYVDGGACTLKGLLPSFSPKAQSAGAIAAARHFVLVNEFLHVVKRVNNDKIDSSYNVLDTMKQILEGKPGYVPSGVGSMTVRMRGSMFLASNWAEIGGDKGRMTTVNAMYEHISAAFLDRLLIYPVDAKLQGDMIDTYSDPAKDMMESFRSKTGITDEVEILEKMPTPYKLNTYDFRTLLSFKEGLVARFDNDAVVVIRDTVKKIRERENFGRFSRTRDMLNNLASAKAFERMLLEGKVDKDTKEIMVIREDAEDAVENLIHAIMENYNGTVNSVVRTRAEWLGQSASQEQRFIVEYLKKAYARELDPKKRRTPVDEVYTEFTKNYSNMSWNIAIRPLIERKVIAWDGANFMWVPDWLNESQMASFFVGKRDALSDETEVLLKVDGEVSPQWMTEIPRQPSGEIQKPIREALGSTLVPIDLETIRHRTQLPAHEVVENAVQYFHLSGEVERTGDSYKLRARSSP